MERKAVRMDYTQLVKRLRWTAANDEQVFDAETAMLAAQAIETMQAQLEQAKAEHDAAAKELQKTKSVAFKAETSNGLCSGELTTY